MIPILLLVAIVSLISGEWTEAAIILAIVFGSSLLGFFQDYRASRAIQGLRARLASRVTVLRDGVAVVVDARRVGPGDVLTLSAGNIVPADGVIMAARDAQLSEAALTGESFPVEKQVGVTDAAAPMAARTHAVFQGTSVRSGTATVLIVRTGGRTEFGAIVGQLAMVDPETDFERGIRRVGLLLTRIMAVIVFFIFAANLLMARPLRFPAVLSRAGRGPDARAVARNRQCDAVGGGAADGLVRGDLAPFERHRQPWRG